MHQEQPELVVVIMAGGAGTRFWPLSTEARPKQFLRLFGTRTLLQMSYDRVVGLVPPERILVLTAEAFVPLVQEQLPQLPVRNVVGEPMRRDTAAAVTLASLLCRQRFGNAVLVVLPADHVITPLETFQRALLSAVRAVQGPEGADALYTFGIPPTYPATGYGYLQRGRQVLADEESPHFELLSFREKPDAALAASYLASGEYYWNSGMFIWQTDAILAQLHEHLPMHVQRLAPVVALEERVGFVEALRHAFLSLPAISIDYGVMEKAPKVRCVAAPFAWSDVGGWLALEPFLAPDCAGNRGRGRLFGRSACRNLVFSEQDDEVVALVGVEDLVVVRAGKRTLIMHRDRTEEVKPLVQQLDEDLK